MRDLGAGRGAFTNALRWLSLAVVVSGCDRGCRGAPPAPNRRGSLAPPARAPTLAAHLAAARQNPPRGETFPQMSDAAARFEAAAPTTLGGDAALICRFRVVGRAVWDGLVPGSAPPDLRMLLRVGEGPVVGVLGPEDSAVAYVTLPIVPIAAETPVLAQAWDRDVTTEEDVGRIEATLPAAMPWVAQSGSLQVECRAVPRAGVEAALTEALRALDEQLTRMEDAPITRALAHYADDPSAPSFATQLQDVAAWVGWADPRVLERRARGAVTAARWDAAASARRTQLTSTLPPPGAVVTTEDRRWDVVVRSAAYTAQEARALDPEAPPDTNCVVLIELVSRVDSAFVPAFAASGIVVGEDGSVLAVSGAAQGSDGPFARARGTRLHWSLRSRDLSRERRAWFVPRFLYAEGVAGGALRLP